METLRQPAMPRVRTLPLHTGHFQALNKRLLVSNDSYLRTTSDLHKETSKRLWQICADKGDIYLGKYEAGTAAAEVHGRIYVRQLAES